jgi:hypothetical protein
MKRMIVIASLFVLTVGILQAQQQTLFSNNDFELGGYFSPVVKFSPVNDDLGVLVGGRGGIILNRTLAIGFGGYGLVSYVEALNRGPLGERYMEVGYGGLDIEYILNPNDLVHFSFSTLIGGGGVLFNERSWGSDYWEDYDHDVDGFFVVEPSMNVDLNVTSFLKTSVGASYRFVSGLKSDASTNGDLSGPSFMISFRIGKF